ncbi:Ger(x)C family spore germination protein [Neobacillus niacini]|uniref:Ger(x)C family spore germination protein n=1 Tax=Neobacillus niacini TaxID=86668 RepID=UPI002040B15A|nr:Ger(x)C family spore germination protein [Neobacillus niacini]
MQRRHKWKLIMVNIACVLTLCSCVETKQLEKLGLITAQGYDLEKENEIKGTVVVHKFDPLAENLTKVITVKSHTSKALRQEQNLEIDQKLVTGQLRCVIYSKELAKRGLSQLVDALNRDPTIGNMVYLTVADDDALSIVNIDQSKLKVNLGTYLYNLIKQNVESEQLTSPTLHEFNHNLQDHGKDPVLPILKLKGEGVTISGIALFKGDRIVGELPSNKLFYAKVLYDKYKSGTHELGFNRSHFKQIIKNQGRENKEVYDRLFISIDNIRSHAKIKLIDKEKLLFRVEVTLDSRLLEATEPLDLTSTKNIKFIEKKINKEMESQIKQLLEFFKKKQVDPIGIGNEYMANSREKPLSKKEWRELYKDAKFEVRVDNTIVKTGVID